MVLNQAVASIELHDRITPLVSGHVLGALYHGQYGNMIQSLEEIGPSLIPEILSDCGIEEDVDLTTNLLLQSIASFDSEKE